MREMLDREERQRMRDMKAQRERKRERGGGGREGGSYSLLIDPLSYPVSWSRQSHLNLHELMADSDPFYTPEFSTGA